MVILYTLQSPNTVALICLYMQGRVGHFVVKAPMVIGHESAGYTCPCIAIAVPLRLYSLHSQSAVRFSIALVMAVEAAGHHICLQSRVTSLSCSYLLLLYL